MRTAIILSVMLFAVSCSKVSDVSEVDSESDLLTDSATDSKSVSETDPETDSATDSSPMPDSDPDTASESAVDTGSGGDTETTTETLNPCLDSDRDTGDVDCSLATSEAECDSYESCYSAFAHPIDTDVKCLPADAEFVFSWCVWSDECRMFSGSMTCVTDPQGKRWLATDEYFMQGPGWEWVNEAYDTDCQQYLKDCP